MEERKYCVYLHRRKDNNEVFYVGQGAINRPFVTTRKLKAWNNVVKDANGFVPDVIFTSLTKSQAIEIEAEYINKYRDTIVNLPTSSSVTKPLDFETFNNLFYTDSSSPTNLRYKVDVFAHVKDNKSYSIIHRANDVAGENRTSSGWVITVAKRGYRVHRIVYLLSNGSISASSEFVIDHIDGNNFNNAITNLRQVSTALNRRNLKLDKRSTTGFTGVSYGTNCTFKASVKNQEGKRLERSFSISKYGEEEAFRLACEWRKEQIRLLNEQGAGYTERHGT